MNGAGRLRFLSGEIMGAWEVRGPAKGACKSWRDKYPQLAEQVVKVTAPHGRGIAWEGTEIWAYRDRPNSITECLAANVARWPDREAYVFYPGGQRMTWGEVGTRVERVAARLRQDFGFRKRDRLCLLMAGCPEYVISYLAIIKLGGIAVPVNLGLTAEGLAAQINKVGARGLVASSEVWNGKLGTLRGGLDSVETVFVIGGEAAHGTLAFSELESRAMAPVEHEAIDEWDLCAISFTSGTTGVPKGTIAMHTNALGCAQNVVIAAQGLDADDVNLCMPPLYHNTAVYADFLPALLSGGKCVIMAAFAPLDAIRLIETERATWAVAAPIMLWMMMNHPEFRNHDCSTLRKILFGGHASSETFINQLSREFSPIAMVNAGAVSESTAVGFALPTDDAVRKITSCGLATPNTDIAIFDDDGNEVLEPNVIGEVAYRGQQTNAGYWEDPGKTAEVFRRDGFVLSGDWAKIDEEGYLWLLDRKKDMIVRGGQNVYCIEVENKLYLHPKVLRAAVVGVPDHVFSERLKAVVVLKPGENATVDEIRDHCAQHLAKYETPEYVVFGDSLPANPAGKTLKPPLVDFWGDIGDTALARFTGFCDSLPAALFDTRHLKVDGEAVTPREALGELERNSTRGQYIARIIEEQGVCVLTTPNEARFRR